MLSRRSRDLPLGAWRLKQQGESVGVMKIRLVGWMAKRPVREPIARLDDRREPDTEGSMRVDGRQDIEPDKGVELKPTASRAHGNVGAHHFVRKRTAVAIAAEGVNGPLPRRGEVELVVRRLPFHRDEGFEAGVVPELCSDARRPGEGIRIRGISPSRRKVIWSSALADRRTSTAMARTASGRVDGWHLRSIQCSTVITGSHRPAGWNSRERAGEFAVDRRIVNQARVRARHLDVARAGHD